MAWKRPIKEYQLQYWNQIFHQGNGSTVARTIEVTNMKKVRKGIPAIQSENSFEGKFQILWDTFFPANVTTGSPPITPGFLPPSVADINNTFSPISPEEVSTALRSAQPMSVTLLNGISYEMLTKIATSLPSLLPHLFTQLVFHQVYPTEWKRAKCVSIPKPG